MPFPWLAAAVAGGALLGAKGVKDTNEANSAQSQRQMDFQERMSNTAHQREVKDLREAGLNPILSARYGGASTPAGAQATMQNAMAPIANSAMQIARFDQEMKNLEATEQATLAQAKKDTATATAVEGTKKPVIHAADLIDKGITGVTSSAKALGEGAAKAQLKWEKWVEQKGKKLMQRNKENRAKWKNYFTDDPNKGWWDEWKKEKRARHLERNRRNIQNFNWR